MQDPDLSREREQRQENHRSVETSLRLADHDLLIEQGVLLKTIAGNLQEMKAQQKEDLSEIKAQQKDGYNALDVRVRVLEAAYWKLLGAGAVAGAVAGFLVRYLPHL